MAKLLEFDDASRASLRAGVEKIARAVKSTLGPRGRNALLDKGWGSPKVTRDGATVAEEIDLANRFENLAARLLREAATKTHDDAGDGTTTSAVLAEAIFLEGLKMVIAGHAAINVVRGIQRGVEAVLERLGAMSRPLKDDEIGRIATIAANQDAEIGKTIADAIRKVGKDGVITIEESKGIETTVEVVQGMQFDRGYLSPHFVTDPEAMVCELENPCILIHEEKISNARDLVPLLEKLAEAKRPLLVIAEEVEGDALATLVVNKMRGILPCVAVKAPAYGDRRKAMLQDIAILTGGKAIFKEFGLKLETVGIKDLGRAKKVIIDQDNTTIIQGAGDAAEISGRCRQIRKELEVTTSDYDREKLQERLAKLAGGVAEIRVAAATESEMKEKKARFESAHSATRAAIEEGILPGGGVALVRAAAVLDDLKARADERIGLQVLRTALAAPLKQIVRNAGFEGPVVIRKILADKETVGFDVVSEKYCDLIEAGIMDPAKVTKAAVKNAASAAAMLLMSDCLVVMEIEKDEDEHGHGHPHGD
ncbi:MAG TPA: chaperonin GroEL [Planctomycetota bacterium]|nr:chaperonin GroEL [Planctomycetota bacterium]